MCAGTGGRAVFLLPAWVRPPRGPARAGEPSAPRVSPCWTLTWSVFMLLQGRSVGAGREALGVGLEAQEPPGTGRVDRFVVSGPTGVKLNQSEQLGGSGAARCAHSQEERKVLPQKEG